MTIERIGVVGAGIVGLAVARRITQVLPGASVTVLDKERSVASHQTGHNSGVVHAGLYYAPGSLKAELCRRGRAMMAEYCADHDLPYETCGKLVVAANAGELAALRHLEQRAAGNQVPGLRRVAAQEIRQIEPHAVGAAALHSPATAISDFTVVARALAADIERAGGRLLLGVPMHRALQHGGSVYVDTGGESLRFDRLVLCAGLQSDIVARSVGDVDEPAIVPFRGEYLRLVPSRTSLVRALIYPVPDPAYPFLGVHFTKRIDGSVDIGPNAVLATAREGYRRRDVSPGELWNTVSWPGFRRLARQHWRMGLEEIAGSMSRRVFLSRAQRYVPELGSADVESAPSGVRAQAVDRDGTLVDDFRINSVGSVLAVRNAPSPAATSSLAIAEHVSDLLLSSHRD